MTCTAASFRAWLFSAAPGERFEYHRGQLAHDRSPETAWPGKPPRELNELANAVSDAAGRGHVLLAQRRNGKSDFSYFAIKRRGTGALQPCRPMSVAAEARSAQIAA